MKVVIVEDELAASDHLVFQLNSIDPALEVIKVIESVKMAVDYFSNTKEAELVFMDIHLADGISFEIFEQISFDTPIIFTTAYNQYAIQAFKVNSVDYLLKPIDADELETAITKFKNNRKKQDAPNVNQQLESVFKLLQDTKKTFKKSFLGQKADALIPIKTENIAWFCIEDGIVKMVTFENKAFVFDKKLESVEDELDPDLFYRVNRQFIMNRNAIVNVKFYFNGKLIVNTLPKASERIVVSKSKATDFKNWLNS